MSHSHTKTFILEVKDKIKKSVVNIEQEQESVVDLLKALETADVDIALIGATDIGNTLNELKKICKEKKIDNILQQVTGILSAWKKLVKGKKDTAESKPQSTPTKPKIPVAEFQKVASPASTNLKLNDVPAVSVPSAAQAAARVAKQAENEQRKKILSADRKAGSNGLSKTFQKKGIAVEDADCHSLDIEAAVNQLFDVAASKARYLEKIKDLAFNLGKNEELRNHVFSGELSAERLVVMTSSEMASQKIRETRERIVQDQYLSHRSDLDNIYRHEIQESLGIDPSNSWIYDQDDGNMSEPDMEAPDM